MGRQGALRRFRAGVDIGGTFTDVILVDDDSGSLRIGKVLTTPQDPSLAAEMGLAEMLASPDVRAEDLANVVHGTTLVTNAIIERKGAKTGLLTTRGFRDALEIRRESRYDLYDLFLELPKPLVPRHLRLEVDERVLADGSVAVPLDREQAREAILELKAQGVEAVAVCLLHSYRNPAHERELGALIRELAPELAVSLSSEVVPEIREYERTSTTAANVYVQPLMDRYLRELEARLRALGVDAQLLVMLSSGGVCTPETARRFPVRLVESGPAAGALAAAFFGQLTGNPRLLSFDMGGTTAKSCLIDEGAPSTAAEFEVARVYRFKKGSGLPIKVPVIEMIEIGAGGGSIARIDSLGLLKVGPESAGADPGPACYGLGGTDPTVTDADLVLGYLDPNFFLGGRMRLDKQSAARAIEGKVAKALGMDVVQAAWGIHEIVNENMANAARVHCVERGKDPRVYPLFAFGGAGPVHAVRVAEILRVPSVICPLGAGVQSALGLLCAPLAFDLVRSHFGSLDEADWDAVNALLREMAEEGERMLLAAGVARKDIHRERSCEMRYAGQGHEVRVPLPEEPLKAEDLLANFEAVYQQLYGRISPDVPVETLNWRMTVRGPRPNVRMKPVGELQPLGAALKGHRPAYFPEAKGYVSTPVYDRYELCAGHSFVGPAILEERECTVVVGPRATVSVDGYANVVIEL